MKKNRGMDKLYLRYKMTIKEATKRMLWNIESKTTQEATQKGERTYNKEIAKHLGITPASYSRLRTGVTQPNIITWYKIIKTHENLIGPIKTAEIINQLSDE